nr:MAG TPA: hypothetical protein [Caudoviricetes sp.]
MKIKEHFFEYLLVKFQFYVLFNLKKQNNM